MDPLKPTLLFFDYDETVRVSPARLPSEATRDAMNCLHRNGHRLILNTGRSKGFIPREALDILPWDGLIAGSTYVEWEGQVLLEKYLSRKALRHAYPFFKKTGRSVLLEGRDVTYSLSDNVSSSHVDLSAHTARFLRDHYDEMRITKITLGGDTSALAPLDRFDGCYPVYHADYTEIILNGYDKSTGMYLLSEVSGIPMSQTVAFGDSVNDAEMIRAADVGVVMPVAPREVQALATLVTHSHAEGVAEGLKTLFPHLFPEKDP